MDVARANALGWLRAVPPTDRVLVVRADGLATPATAWETDHRKIARAILESQPGATALNLSQNLEFARELQRQSGATAGEIVYAGPGRISAREANNAESARHPRVSRAECGRCGRELRAAQRRRAALRNRRRHLGCAGSGPQLRQAFARGRTSL